MLFPFICTTDSEGLPVKNSGRGARGAKDECSEVGLDKREAMERA